MGLLYWKRKLDIELRLPAPLAEETDMRNSMRDELHDLKLELLHASIAAERLSMERTRLEIQRTHLEIARLEREH